MDYIDELKNNLVELEQLDALHYAAQYELWEATYVDTERQTETVAINHYMGKNSLDCIKQAIEHEEEWTAALLRSGESLEYGGVPLLKSIRYVTIIEVLLGDAVKNVLERKKSSIERWGG